MSRLMNDRSRRFVMAVWDGGGNAPPQIAIGRRLVERGHRVHVLGDPSLADAAGKSGCSFSPWQRGTAQTPLDASDTKTIDWATEEPLDVVRNIRDFLQSGRASEFAADTAAAIEEFRPDVVAPDSQLFGAMIAAEEAGLPVAALVPNLWMLPIPETGDPASVKILHRVMKAGLPDLNAARAERGLRPLGDFYDQLLGLDRILVLTSESFDPAAPFLPNQARYVGPVLDDPEWVEPWSSPWPESNQDPLVLVSFSQLFQNQGPLLQRIIDALGCLSVRAVASFGRSLESNALTAADNVAIARYVPHGKLLRDASLMISHCGHGTTMKALTTGVPMVCIPMGRDQDATAAAVARQGAGIVLVPGACSVERIGEAVREVLDNDAYRINAQRLAVTFAKEHQGLDAVLELERLAGLEQ
jgi:MGT family glycosyltransferase